MAKTTATKAVDKSTAPASIKVDSAALLARIAEVTADKLGNEQIKNRTDKGIASKVAKTLNREGQFRCDAHPEFWTGAHVLSYVAKNG